MAAALSYREFWTLHAARSTTVKYRRTYFGPLWIVFGFAIFVFTVGWLFSDLLGWRAQRFLPHFAVGLMCWTFISSVVVAGSRSYLSGRQFLLSMRLPPPMFSLSFIYSEAIETAHLTVVAIPVVLLFGFYPDTSWLLLLPAVAIYAITAVFTSTLLSVITLRFRDVGEFMSAIMRFMFFLTPIIWDLEESSHLEKYINWNPFYHYIEMVRDPLLNRPVDPLNWIVTGAVTLALGAAASAVYGASRSRLTYWI
ncbi:MAG: ABC transporter permease [Maricaulaceae bacterium]